MQFAQFARTVADAAVDHQTRLREALVGFAYHISSTARDINATWPMVRLPYYELHAGQVRLQSGIETIGFHSFVEPQDEEEYLEFVTANHEAFSLEGHMLCYGNLEHFTSVGYTPNFTTLSSNGYVVDDVDRQLRSPFWHFSPRTFVSSFYLCR